MLFTDFRHVFPYFGNSLLRVVFSKTCLSGHLFHASMYSFPKTGKYIEINLYSASTCVKQADFDYPIGACLIQVGPILHVAPAVPLSTMIKKMGLLLDRAIYYTVCFKL